MPKVFEVKARTDRYRLGKKVEVEKSPRNKKGYKIDKSQPRDENDVLFCKKGDTYYHFTKRYGGRVEMLTRPKPSQLTSSQFNACLWSIGEELQEFSAVSFDEIEDKKQEVIERLEELRGETEEKLENIPENLKYAPVGEVLQERIDGLEGIIDEVECVETDLDYKDGEELQYLLDSAIEEFLSIDFNVG